MRERPRSADGDRRMAGARVDENIALGVGRHAGYFTQMDVGWEFQRVGRGIESDLRHRRLGRGGDPGKESGGQNNLQVMSHEVSSYLADAETFADCGFKMSFCTRH